jgi:hypothetical protein
MRENNDGFDRKKALKNLKKFRKGFEKVYGKTEDIKYVNYERHEKFIEMYDSASEEERMSSYVVRNGDSLYVDLQCLLNCTEEEAYMMGMCIESKRLLVQQYA